MSSAVDKMSTCAKCGKPWEAFGSPARCPVCGEVSFAIVIQLSSPASTSQKKRWQDPEYRAKMSATIKKRWQDPEYRAKMSAADKKRCQDPEYRAKMSAAIKKRWQDPEYRAKQSAAIKKRGKTLSIGPSRALLIQVDIPQPIPKSKGVSYE